MLISNGNSTSLISATAEMPDDGIKIEQISAQLAAPSGELTHGEDVPADASSEIDFESILMQQQLQLKTDESDSSQLIDNKTVIDNSEKQDEDPELTFNIATLPVMAESQVNSQKEISSSLTSPLLFENETQQPVDKKQILNNSDKDSILLAETISTQPATDSPMMATAIPQVDPDQPGSRKIGDKLPPLRQLNSAMELPSRITRTESSSPALFKVLGSEEVANGKGEDGIPFEGKILPQQLVDEEFDGKSLADIKSLQQDKTLFNQSTTHLLDTPDSIFTQTHPLSISTPQNLSSQSQLTALPGLQLSPQAPAAQWGEALAERVSLAINKRLNSAEIRLDPPHLGKLDIHIQIKDDNATVLIHTQHAHTRDMIDASSLRLREVLQDAGYGSVDVEVSHQQQSMAGGDQMQQQDDGQKENHSQQIISAQQELDDIQHSNLYLNFGNNRIDYFV